MRTQSDLLVVQYSRGITALVWRDPVTLGVLTSHAGLSAMLHQGVRDWNGRLLYPHNGQAFLEAVYDRLFMNGVPVRWMSGAPIVDIQRSYRV